MKKKSKHIINLKKVIIYFSFIFLLAPANLFADTFRLNLGLWMGENKRELERRFFLDDLLFGFDLGRINFGWTGMSDVTLYPFGFEYLKNTGKGKILFGGNFITNSTDIKYTGISFAPYISLITLKDYSSRDYEIYAGYQIPLQGKKITLTPRIGGRRHNESFNYEEMSFGENIVWLTIGDNIWEASANSIFAAAEAKFKLNEKISLLIDILISPPFLANWGGEMKHERLLLGRGGNTTIIAYEDVTAGYEMNYNRTTLGVEYKANNKLRFQAGIRQETARATYPSFFSLPIIISGGRIRADLVFGEILTDIFIYSATKESEKGFLFGSVSYDIDL